MAIDDKQLIALLTNFKVDSVQSVDHRIGIFQEDIQHKIDLVVEGQQSLGERMDRFEGRMTGIENRLERVEVRGVAVEMKVDALDKKVDAVEKKVDVVAVDVAAHRRDTEAHRKGWRVSEGE
jgi:predicted nuclease with TOPRIM domain